MPSSVSPKASIELVRSSLPTIGPTDSKRSAVNWPWLVSRALSKVARSGLEMSLARIRAVLPSAICTWASSWPTDFRTVLISLAVTGWLKVTWTREPPVKSMPILTGVPNWIMHMMIAINPGTSIAREMPNQSFLRLMKSKGLESNWN
ncbi:hypothetical protein D3C72_1244280 [compost metagenome]